LWTWVGFIKMAGKGGSVRRGLEKGKKGSLQATVRGTENRMWRDREILEGFSVSSRGWGSLLCKMEKMLGG